MPSYNYTISLWLPPTFLRHHYHHHGASSQVGIWSPLQMLSTGCSFSPIAFKPGSLAYGRFGVQAICFGFRNGSFLLFRVTSVTTNPPLSPGLEVGCSLWLFPITTGRVRVPTPAEEEVWQLWKVLSMQTCNSSIVSYNRPHDAGVR